MADNVAPHPTDSTTVTRRPSPGSTVVRRRPSPTALSLRPSPAMLKAAPELARVAAVSAFQMLSWTVGATAAGANYVARRAVAGQPATAILQEAAGDLRNFALRTLGLDPGTVPTVTLGPAGKADAANSVRGASVRELQ